MTHLDKQGDGLHPIWKILIVMSFAMLSTLTWGAKPIANTFEQIKKKQRAIAVVKLCRQIREKEDIWAAFTKSSFTSGCLYQAREILIELQPQKRDMLTEMFDKQKDPVFDKFKDDCANAAHQYLTESRINGIVMEGLYHQELDCPKWEDYARTLEITDEDLK